MVTADRRYRGIDNDLNDLGVSTVVIPRVSKPSDARPGHSSMPARYCCREMAYPAPIYFPMKPIDRAGRPWRD